MSAVPGRDGSSSSASRVLFTYNYLDTQPNLIERRDVGWHSHLTVADIDDIVASTGCNHYEKPASDWNMHILHFDRS